MAMMLLGSAALAASLLFQKIEHIQPKEMSKPRGYSHVVTAEGGKTVWVAGQVALDGEGKLVGKGDFKAQLVQVYENLKKALAAAGATFDDVVKVNAYVVNLSPARVAEYREIRPRYIGNEKPPASTLAGVQALASEDFLVEIEVTAVVKR